jgi:hypothetical protein
MINCPNSNFEIVMLQDDGFRIRVEGLAPQEDG